MSTDFFNISILPYTAIISKICRVYTDTEEDFEDYYQEVCLQIWRSRHNFKKTAQWSTYVYRLTLNVCLTLNKKRKISTTSLEGLTSSHVEHFDQGNNSDQIDKLYLAIKKLNKIDRAIILLYLEEKPYEEIAKILQTSASNIGTRVNRIKHKLKALLNGKIN